MPVDPGGSLHDYVPFYFGYLSPMLYAIHTGRVPGSDGKQGSMVYLVSTVQRVVSGGLHYVFTDCHAAMQLTEYYTDLADLNHVDFEVANARYWSDTEQDPDRKRRKQAEFLIRGAMQLSCLAGVAVMTTELQERTMAILRSHGCQLDVKVWRNGCC